MAKTWTEIDEYVVIREVSNHYNNKRFAFETAAEIIGKSACSCCTRYYNVILPRLVKTDSKRNDNNIYNIKYNYIYIAK